jgi:hypothetical protein
MPIISSLGSGAARSYGFSRQLGAAILRDPFFRWNSLLLQNNPSSSSTNNQVFVDSSTNNFPITRVGNATQGTFSPFSQTGWSTYFTGTSYVTLPANTNYDITNGDFTIEFWLNWQKGNTMQYSGISIMTNFLTSVGWFVGADSGSADSITAINFGVYSGGFTVATNSALNNTSVPKGTWNHFAIVRSGSGAGNLKYYLNGVNTGGSFNCPTYAGAGSQLAFGVYQQNLTYAGNPDFSLSNLRILKDRALYLSDFTPPTAPLTAIENTVLLTHQDNRFLDNSSINAPYSYGTAGTIIQPDSPLQRTSAYSPVLVGGSAYFGASTDYVTAAGNAAFQFGTDDFTVAAWIYPTVAQTTTVVSSNYNFSSATGNWSLYFGVGSAQILYFNSNLGNKASSTTVTIPINAWTHVAYTRVGSTARFFVNGVQLGTTISDSFNYGGASGTLFVGRQNDGTGFLTGFMSGLQILKGTGYSSLPIPTSPPTNISNTSFLINATNAAIIDSTTKTDVQTLGATQLSGVQSKYSGVAMIFNGTSSYIKFPPSQAYNFSSADFTIELWIYRAGAGSSGSDRIFQTADGDVYTGINLFDSSGTVNLYYSTTGSSWATTVVGTISTAWSHIAIVRSGANLLTFQNGVITSNNSLGTSTLFFSATQTPIIGGQTGGRFFNGYMEDFRITKFARYTANFTPPEQPLPRQ